MALPTTPAPPAPFDPLTETLLADTRLWRVHDLRREGDSYNDTGSMGRFRPIPLENGRFVPTAYVGDSPDAAISETAFHDLPVTASTKTLSRSITDGLMLSPLTCARELILISLRGHGLRRLGVTHGSLIEVVPPAYAGTVAWGSAAYAHEPEADGMVWMSRQFSGGAAMLLFGDRVGNSLRVDGDPLPLASGQGFEVLTVAANRAGVALIAP